MNTVKKQEPPLDCCRRITFLPHERLSARTRGLQSCPKHRDTPSGPPTSIRDIQQNFEYPIVLLPYSTALVSTSLQLSHDPYIHTDRHERNLTPRICLTSAQEYPAFSGESSGGSHALYILLYGCGPFLSSVTEPPNFVQYPIPLQLGAQRTTSLLVTARARRRVPT